MLYILVVGGILPGNDFVPAFHYMFKASHCPSVVGHLNLYFIELLGEPIITLKDLTTVNILKLITYFN